MTEGRALIAALIAVLAVLLPSRASFGAVPQRPLSEAIQVNRGATCVEADALAEHVATWLGTDTADADVWVRVEGSPDDPRVVSFEMGRAEQRLAHRRFAPGPEACEHLQAALGLAIALAIRASLLDEIVGPREPAPHAPAPPKEFWALGGDLAAAAAILPGASFGGGIHLERTFPHDFALRLGILGLATWHGTFETAPGSFDAEIAAVRADACVGLELAPRLAARGCAGILGGALLAQGRGFPSSRNASAPWFAVANGLELDVALEDNWSLDGELALVVPLGSTQARLVSATGDVKESRDLSSTGVIMTLGPVYRF
jgi:hypothetical protein